MIGWQSVSSEKVRSDRVILYEVMNLAQLFKLPVIYVCENNFYTEYTHYSETTAGDDSGAVLTRLAWHQQRSMDRMCARYTTLPSILWNGRAVAMAPHFSNADTYRYHGHHVGRHQPRVLSIQAGRTSLERGPGSYCHASRVARRTEVCGHRNPRPDCIRRSSPRWKKAVQFAMNGAYPDVE